jgi:glycosyltransferase involved in cell wall biosynthesis
MSQDSATVAVIILTFNEERHLARAIESIRGFAKEIFIIDSFSTDTTVEIGLKHGAKILQNPFEYQAKQFDWALGNAGIESDWVMRLDADEVVEPDLAAEIEANLCSLPSDVTGVNLKRKTIFQGRFIRHGGRYPLTLLRIWRRGKARIENRMMDEHIYLTEGRTVTFQGGFADHNLLDLTSFTEKHNRYATREALDVLNSRLNLYSKPVELTGQVTARQAILKRLLKERVYNRIPFEISSTAYFIYRYFFQLGFLDGREGLVYHFLQGFWYRFLVGAKLRELELAAYQAKDNQELRRELARLTGRQFNL